ncbi:MAG: endonuclease/exonuclease/phosphatase family protein [Saprospiraceae bacterium]|jgi:hypothetical protein|nr:endonuclease/exonuclease/phosphatase family protein [Saprospiraceae bacterium]
MDKLINTSSRMLSVLIVLATVLAILLPYIDIYFYGSEYLVHMMFVMIFLGFMGLILQKREILFAGFLCAGILALFLKNASNISLKFPKENYESGLYVAHVNLSAISDLNTIDRIVADSTIEVISFQEYTPEWGSVLPEKLVGSYPFIFQFPGVDLYGKAIFSKYIIRKENILQLETIPNVELEIEKNGTGFNLVSVYLTPALDKYSKKNASAQLVTLSDKIQLLKTRTIVMGEFNQVYWSNDVIRFRNTTGLLNSRRDIIPNKIKMPYDHIFHTTDLECSGFEELLDAEGNHIGSKGKFQIRNDHVYRK